MIQAVRRRLRKLVLLLARLAGQWVAWWQLAWQRLFQPWFTRQDRPVARSAPRSAKVPARALAQDWRYWRSPQAGFVLPTTALLLLVVILTVTALSLRTLNRTEQVAGDRQQKIIYNAATPAIDRARVKLEKLFTDDGRLPSGGVPSEKFLYAMLSMDGKDPNSGIAIVEPLTPDPYTLPGETRLPGLPNAWQFQADTNGDGVEDVNIAYSIILTAPEDAVVNANGDFTIPYDEASVKKRAQAFQTRTGPIITSIRDKKCDLRSRLENSAPLPYDSGWFQDPNKSSTMRKNFQVDAVATAIPGKGITSGGIKTIATLELQQDKLAERGNKWAAWFRTDLEVFAGPSFFWNGAMHTEGSMFLAGPTSRNAQTGLLLVSSRNSCVYSPEASLLSVRDQSHDTDPPLKDYDGEFLASALSNSSAANNRLNFAAGFPVNIDYQKDPSDRKSQEQQGNKNFTPSTDSVSAGTGANVQPYIIDSLQVFTADLTRRPGKGNLSDGSWTNQDYVKKGRVQRSTQPKPYLDDFYRADNRYGPRPNYGRKNDQQLTSATKAGTKITGNPTLTRDTNPSDTPEVGSDGYWERRANNEGMKIIVGERLTLGSDSLNLPGYPNLATDFSSQRTNETLQRRSLRDPLAAVQSTLVYHNAYRSGQEPVSAIASVVHPGTPDSLRNSLTVEKPPTGSFPVKSDAHFQTLFGSKFGDGATEWAIDFFNGRGTNGWEFPTDDLISQFRSRDAGLTNALVNLATFAGDRKGAFPAQQETGVTHPYPQQVKWGNFSNLRRSIEDDAGSPADQTNRHTAATSLGMLAYNLSYLDALDYSDTTFQTKVMQPLAEALGRLADPYDPNLLESDDCLWQTAAATGTASAPSALDLARTPNKLCKSLSKTQGTGQSSADAESLQRDQEIAGPPVTLVSGGLTLDSKPSTFGGRVDVYRIAPTTNNTAGGQPFGVRVYGAGLTSSKKTDLAAAGLASIDIQLSTPIDANNKVSPSPVVKIGKVDYGYRDSNPNTPTVSGTPSRTKLDIPRVPPEAYVAALGKVSNTTSPSLNPISLTEAQWWARLIALKEQVQRDRTFGFADHVGKAKLDDPTKGISGYQYRVVFLRDERGLYTTADLKNKATNPDLVKDLNRNGVIDSVISDPATTLFKTVSELPEEDVNGNGKLDIPEEDLNGDGKLNTDENFDGNAIAKTPLSTTGLQEYASKTGTASGQGKEKVKFGDGSSPTLDRDANGDGLISRPYSFWLGGRQYKYGGVYEFGCNLSPSGNNFFGFGPPKTAQEELRLLRLATTLCPVEAKYPSLYYTFPTYDHPLQGAITTVTPSPQWVTTLEDGKGFSEAIKNTASADLKGVVAWAAPQEAIVTIDHTQPLASKPSDVPFLDPYLTDPGVKASVGSYVFKSLDAPAIAKLALVPAANQTSAWRLPRDTYSPSGTCTNSAPLCMDLALLRIDPDPIQVGGETFLRLGFRDSALFNGRDMLLSRALDVDIEMLRDAKYIPTKLAGQLWLTVGDPKQRRSGGIVFAFREDAIREDAIARSPSTGWSSYVADPNNTGTRMRLDANGGQDPPLNTTTGISPKPVDFYPDPDRRAYGFRLHDGDKVKRLGKSESDPSGMSVITDNVLYVQGNFNRHRAGTVDIEEFTQKLSQSSDYSTYVTQFYGRTTLDDRFANPAKDDWRPVELLADAVIPLSDNACDGSIRDALGPILNSGDPRNVYGCADARSRNTSFTNTNLPSTPDTTRTIDQWWHENRFDLNAPISIDRSGLPLVVSSQAAPLNRAPQRFPALSFQPFSFSTTARTTTPVAQATEMDMVLVSSLLPSRVHQSNGGLHNFPPFNENWSGINLILRGAFLQLNFRTSSTGPYDNDAWEPVDSPKNGEATQYYQAPNRLWGYDPGLQYAQVGPISSRFLTLGSTRSEFYSEPPATDPYICQLRKAIGDSAAGCN